MSFTTAQKRAFSRICHGIERHRGDYLRFLTLTTHPLMGCYLDDAWRALKGRIQRYLAKDNKNFEYIRIATGEGATGVYHILFFGDKIPQALLSHWWREITTTAYIVDIRAVNHKVERPKKLAGYCVRQYVAGQDAYIRFSTSWGWCVRGYIGFFKKLVMCYGYERAKVKMRGLIQRGFVYCNGFYYYIHGRILEKFLLWQSNVFAWTC